MNASEARKIAYEKNSIAQAIVMIDTRIFKAANDGQFVIAVDTRSGWGDRTVLVDHYVKEGFCVYVTENARRPATLYISWQDIFEERNHQGRK